MAGRARPARRATAVAEAPTKKDEKQRPRGWVWLLAVSFLWPLLSYFFLSETSVLNHLVENMPPWVEVTTYLTLSLVFWLLVRSQIFGLAVKTLVEVTCAGLKRLGLPEWRVNVVRKLAKPLARVSQGVLVFLTANLAVNAVPEHAAYKVPKLFSFIDANKDGILDAQEIETFFFAVASRVLLGWFALQAALFVEDAKSPPESEVEGRCGMSKYFYSLQRLRGIGGPKDRKFACSKEALAVQVTDKAISLSVWAFVVFVWSRLAELKLSTVVALGGVGGLAVSLAAKNIMQNLISGALIFIHRAVVVGDEIKSSDGKISGFVDSIKPTRTVIHRLDGEPLIVPNTMIVDNSIINVQRRDYWLVESKYPLMLDSFVKLPEVIGKMQETLEAKVQPYQDCKRGRVYQEPLVYFGGYGHQGADVKVRCYLDGALERHQFYKARSEILMAVSDAALSFKGVNYGFEAHHIGGSGDAPSHGGH